MSIRIGIIGSRNITSSEVVFTTLDAFFQPIEEECEPRVILGGGSKGSERLVQDWCHANGEMFVLFKPYNFIDTGVEHHPKYFFFRNKQIIDNADKILVFLDDTENGVKRSIDYLKTKTTKPYKVVDQHGIVIEER